MNNLKQRYLTFLETIADPWVLVFTLATVALIIASFQNDDPKVLALLNLLITFSSSTVGALITKNFLKETEGRVIRTKGESAVRNLKLLFTNIQNLETRVNRFLVTDKSESIDLTKAHYEEILSKTETLEEEVINSIETWKDIVPDADIKTQIGLLSSLRKEVLESKKERDYLTDALKQIKERGETNQSKIGSLQSTIHARNEKIKALEKSLEQKTRELESGSLSGLSLDQIIAHTLVDTNKQLSINIDTPISGSAFDSLYPEKGQIGGFDLSKLIDKNES